MSLFVSLFGSQQCSYFAVISVCVCVLGLVLVTNRKLEKYAAISTSINSCLILSSNFKYTYMCCIAEDPVLQCFFET